MPLRPLLMSLPALLVPAATHAAVLGVSDIDTAPTADPVDSTAAITSFTNSAGSFAPLTTLLVTNANTIDGSDAFRNYWPGSGSEIDGAAAIAGNDIGHGAIDLAAADFQFGTPLGDGNDTNGNDIVLFEIGGTNAGTVVKPLDAAGNPIGDFSRTLADSDWADAGGITFRFDNESTGEGGPSTSNINGVGFDLSDFTGTGALDTSLVTGFRVTSSEGLDLGVAATVPEPASLGLLLAGGLLMAPARRRRR